jgi:peptide chain release factor 2
MNNKLLVLQNNFTLAYEQLDIDAKKEILDTLLKQSEQPNYWDDTAKAQSNSKKISKLQLQINPWIKLKSEIEEINNLFQMKDDSLQSEIASMVDKITENFEILQKDLLFTGSYDDHDVLMSVYAGAGGTDAQDWAQMIFRMYSRWAEDKGFKLSIIDQSNGEEAGIKTITFSIQGEHAYGLLKSEAGVHRLVRLSPFNSDNLRQTSFAKVQVLPEIENDSELELDEKTLKIDVYRAGGHGGQSVNTTDSAVRITHIPTGITVAIQNERSQLQNRETALKILKSQLLQLKIEQHQEKLSNIKGPNLSAEWGNQIRNYVLHPYKQVKDTRTKYESSNPDEVLSGKLDPFIDAYLKATLTSAE